MKKGGKALLGFKKFTTQRSKRCTIGYVIAKTRGGIPIIIGMEEERC